MNLKIQMLAGKEAKTYFDVFLKSPTFSSDLRKCCSGVTRLNPWFKLVFFKVATRRYQKYGLDSKSLYNNNKELCCLSEAHKLSSHPQPLQ